MTNEVIRGVAKVIASLFPDIPVFTEKVDQGIIEPSFVVRCFRNQHGRYRGQRFRKTHSIEVQYFPPVKNRRENAHSVEEKLFWALEYITVGTDTIRGEKMDVHMDEDYTVIFTVNYDYFVIQKNDEIPMEDLSEEVLVNDGEEN